MNEMTNDRILQIKRAHASAKPTDTNPAWLNTHRDLGVVLEALEAAIPQGWKLVPIEPTQEMCVQGQWKAQEWPKFPLRISPIYKAMLAAVPTAPSKALAKARGQMK